MPGVWRGGQLPPRAYGTPHHWPKKGLYAHCVELKLEPPPPHGLLPPPHGLSDADNGLKLSKSNPRKSSVLAARCGKARSVAYGSCGSSLLLTWLLLTMVRRGVV